MSFNSDSEIMELVYKIDLLLQGKENRPLPPNDIATAYDIAKTITKLYPSNYLGFLKMAQVCMCRQVPLLIDRGSEQNYTCTKNYSDIVENLKQAKILASANKMPEIDTIDMQFKQKISCEEKRINERHAFIIERMPILIRNYPQILNQLKLIPPNQPSIIAGNHLSFIDNKKNIVFDGDFVKYSQFLGCLCFCEGKLYYCSNSIYSKNSFWSGTSYFCKQR